MKKLLIFLTSFIFSCQSSNIIVKPYKEVNNLNKEYVLDLGYKGPSIKINLNFNKSNPFVIKNIDDSFNGISSVSRIEIRLSSSQGTSLADRFGNNCPCPPNTRNGVAYIDLINPALNNSITVKGLKPSTDYYISARAYASLRVNGSTQEINVTSSDGTPSDTLGGGTSGAFGNFGINEEYISVDNNGVLTINNDDNDNNVANGLNPNHDWDISIQLMKSKGARINNNEINIQDGSTSTTTNSNLVYSSYTNNKIANRYMLYNQRNPSVAIADNGRYMIAWEGQGSGDNDGIFARLYDENGNSLVDEILVNQTTTGNQLNPKVATDGTNFQIVWEGQGSGDNDGIFGRKFDNDGLPLTNELLINTNTIGTQSNPALAKNTAGNTIVIWQSYESGNYDIKGQYFSSSGKIGSEFTVNSYTTGDQLKPSVVIDNSGNFIIAWNGEGEDDDDSIYIRKFDNNPSPTTNDIRVNENISLPTEDVSISIDKNNNNFAVAFVSDNKVNLQKYYSDMKKKGNEIIFSSINNSYQTNLSLSNHTGILTWLDGTSPSQGVINFKMFNMIDNNIINYAIDYNNMLSHPFVVLNGKKGIITWTDLASSASNGDIYFKNLLIP